MKRKYTKDGWAKIVATARANNIKKKDEAVLRYNQDPNICQACGGVIPLRDSIYTTRKKRFCNHRCAAHFMNKTRVVVRTCAHCSKTLISSQRGYCSWACRIASKFFSQRDQWLAGSVSGGYSTGALKEFAKKHLIEARGERCESCGWDKVNQYTGKIPLTFHHIDGNPLNHRPENIRILCPSCHSLTETYGGANRGNGRKNRKR